MKTHKKPFNYYTTSGELVKRPDQKQGFTLVLTLSIMVLLTVIGVGYLSLSAISLRTSSHGMAMATARSNARLGLMMALGQLQKTLGTDQAVSANSGAVVNSAGQPNILGAWNGRGWKVAGATGLNNGSATGEFRSWLVSTTDPLNATKDSYPASTPNTQNSVLLVNNEVTGSINNRNTDLSAELVPVDFGSMKGSYAYAVMDESQKAPINVPDINSNLLRRDERNYALRRAAIAPNFTAVSNDLTLKNEDKAKLTTIPNLDLAISGNGDKTAIKARIHDITSNSYGLITDVVNGGLKFDLTPLFAMGAGNNNNTMSTALGIATPYTTSFNNVGANDGVPSWAVLRSFYRNYSRITTNAKTTPTVVLNAGSTEYTNSNVGTKANPAASSFLPVISKMQLILSMVSHYSHIGDRVTYYDGKDTRYSVKPDPVGNVNHAAIHLVYEPIITLYNPYDVKVDFPQLRVRVSDPPVGFQFIKHDMKKGTSAVLRQEFTGGDNGQFHSLAMFQIANEKNPNARRFYTLQLRNRNSAGVVSGNISLLPGETKVFSAYVEPNWTWGLETSGGYTPRAFFDWQAEANIGSIDFRTKNQFGVDGMIGWDPRAGFQTDHISYASTRPLESKYDFEIATGWGGGWVGLRLTDDITVRCRARKTTTTNLADFRVDLLAGKVTDLNNEDLSGDVLRSYSFYMNDPAAEMGFARTIERRFNTGNILQKPGDTTLGGKTPFAVLAMSAKTTKNIDPTSGQVLDDSKAWLHNNPAIEGARIDTRSIGFASQPYELRLDELKSGFNSFPGVEIDPATFRGYFGAANTASRGVNIVPMFHVPRFPAASLGDFVNANLAITSQLPRVNSPLGNSFAHPLISSEGYKSSLPATTGTGTISGYDHCFLMNSAMWDRYFFSTIQDYTTAAFDSTRAFPAVMSDFLKQTNNTYLLNTRFTPNLNGENVDDIISKTSSWGGTVGAVDASQQMAKYVMVKGPFNVNSASEDAWTAMLASLREASIQAWGAGQTFSSSQRTPFSRFSMPIAGASDTGGIDQAASINAAGQIRWAGYRTLTDAQISTLAKQIVTQIKARNSMNNAPFLSLGEFINRRLASGNTLFSQKGVLQTAIDFSAINQYNGINDDNATLGSPLGARSKGISNMNALIGNSAEGTPSFLTQADVLQALAPIITVRGDTFTIRAYGEAKSSDGNFVIARAWCEASVQRTVDYVDNINNRPEDRNYDDLPQSLRNRFVNLTADNQYFGRRFVITSFRWMSNGEVEKV